MLQEVKKGPLSALTFESSKNFILTYFQKLMWFYLLATKDSLFGKVRGKTFLRCEIPWTALLKIREVKLIFLDEFFMVGNTMFNVQINNRLKDVMGSKELFGGVSIIVLGDLFQLETVMDAYGLKDMKNSEYQALAPNLWQELFTMFELEGIMRQSENKEFSQPLNTLREGKYAPDDIAELRKHFSKFEKLSNLCSPFVHTEF